MLHVFCSFILPFITYYVHYYSDDDDRFEVKRLNDGHNTTVSQQKDRMSCLTSGCDTMNLYQYNLLLDTRRGQ